MSGFRRKAERVIWNGAVITVAHGTFLGPDGSTFERDVVHHPGAVSIVPVLGDSAVLVRQYRAAIDDLLLEIPAGKRDVVGETPEQVAQREVIEEIGLRAGRLELLARFYNSPGFSDEDSWVFLGTDLTEAATDVQDIEEQHMTVERVPLADVPSLIAAGQLRDAKTIIGLMLARARLGLE